MVDEGRIVTMDTRVVASKEQKAGLIFVIVCGFGAMVLGGLYIWKHVASPFVITYAGPKLLVGDEKTSAAQAKEKQADTDKDQISDYDEKYIYGTSAYIADTDGDGQSDYAEITAGQDPNCATGQACDNILQNEDALRNAGASGTFVDGLTEPVAPEDVTYGTDTTNTTDTVTATSGSEQQLTVADIEAMRSLSTAQIRELLVTSGADSTSIAGMTEEQVRQTFNDLLDSLSASLSESTDSSTTQP